MRDERRDRGSGVEYDATARVLRVGQRQRRLPRGADNRAVLEGYLDLVAAQRPAPPRHRVHLRDRDIDMLAELLDLDDEALEEQLADLLDLTELEAHELGKRLRAGRLRLAAAAVVGAGVLSLAPLAGSTDSSPAPPSRPVVATNHVTSEPTTPLGSDVTVAAPEPAPPPEPAAAPAAQAEPEPELGPATVIERADDGEQLTYIESAPAPIAEDGTDIGTALVIERG
jgi:hypothetical protein